MKPEELGCFEQVKAVLGERGAIEELQKIIDSDLIEWNDHENEDVMYVFTWEYSPQGFSFWLYVHEGAVPPDYTPPSETKNIIEPAGITPEQMDEIKEFIVKELNAKLDKPYQLAQHITEGAKAANDDVFEEPEIVPWEPVGGEWVIDGDGDLFKCAPNRSYANFGTERPSQEQAEKARDEMRVFNRLLAYRDEFDPDFDFEKAGGGYYVFMYDEKYEYQYDDYLNRNIGCVYMSKKVVEELCMKLNSGEVVL